MSEYKVFDISEAQRGLNIEKLKEAGAKAVILRGGIGNRKDYCLDAHIAGCEENGLPYGIYWFSYAFNVEEAKAEAKACLDTIKGLKTGFPIFYDIEMNSQIDYLNTKTRTNIVVTFCEEIKKAGYEAGIYSNLSWLRNYLDYDRLKSYPVWLAFWTEDPDERPIDLINKYKAVGWQWGLDEVENLGIDGDIFFNPEYIKVTPDKPEKEEAKIKVGQKVTVNAGALFSGGIKPFSFVYVTAFDVQRISKDGKEALIGLDGQATGWMAIDDLTVIDIDKKPETTENSSLKVGDKVKVKAGATTYYGGGLASFVYNTTYDVIQVGTKDKPDYIVIGIGSAITAAVNEKDLIKI